MTHHGHNPNLLRWKWFGNKTPVEKMHLKNGDIDQWRKRVEMASEFAVSEVFSTKKPHLGSLDLAMPLQSSDQLKDHDDAYSEAQTLLGDWLHSKLRLELEMDEEDDLICPAERSSPVALDFSTPTAPIYNNFDDMYNCLTEEEEGSAINNFLQDLMEQEVLDSAVMEQLAMDAGQTRKKFRNPAIMMNARHQQVRENKARRDAERMRQQKERDAQQEAREEAKRREREQEMRRKQKARRQEDMLQQEMVRLRRQMEEKRCLQQLACQREYVDEEKAASKSLQCTPPISKGSQQLDKKQLHKEQQVQTLLYMHNIKCLQRHFTGWFSVVLNQRIRMDKAKTVCGWRRKLRVWRAWRTLVWVKQKQREVARTEEELRTENRQYLLAVQSDKMRLLRRCLNEWQLWSQMERKRRDLLGQQQETRRKMAALISAATSGKLKATQNPKPCQPVMTPTETAPQTETECKEQHKTGTASSDTSAVHQDKNPGTAVAPVAQPTQPWQISRQHVAPTGAELRRALQKDHGSSTLKNLATPGNRFEHRHTVQQQIISQQRKLLKEQQDQIAQLKKEQRVMDLELEVQKTAQLIQLTGSREARPRIQKSEPKEKRAPRVTGQPDSPCAPQKNAVTLQICPHPVITAMEARAQQRAERRKQIEEIKKKKEEEKLAEMKAAEELRQREEEEEKRRAAERRREERRLEREREEEKLRQLKRQQELMKLARQHYHRTLLLRRGLAPWKRLIQLRQANLQLAESHHNLFLLRQCTLGWQQTARQSLSEKEASADQLHQHFLLRRSLSSWTRLKDWRMIQEERAVYFYRSHTLRRVLRALLDFVNQERLLEWDLQELAEKHNSRRVLQRCFVAWRQFPCLLQRERVKEERRGKLVRKVVEVLPDFCSYPS